MDYDLALVIGMVIGILSIPSVVSAMTEGRTPRVAAFTLIAGGALIVWAVAGKPGGYRFAEVPDIFAKVIVRYIK